MVPPELSVEKSTVPPALAGCGFQLLQIGMWALILLLVAAITAQLFDRRAALASALVLAPLPVATSVTLMIHADTLFSLGCGRLLEGTAAEMFASLRKFAVLPPETLVCCGHEYTESNARFALHVDPGNPALQAYAESVRKKRAQGLPTVPSLLSDELATNPFLRAPDVATLADLRAQKDKF